MMKRYTYLILLALGLVAWHTQASIVSATCLEGCGGKLVFSDCTSPPLGEWPQGQDLHVMASCETCCAPPGGPVSCEPSEPRFMLKDGQGEISGKFDKTEISCEDQAVWRFKGQLELKSYHIAPRRNRRSLLQDHPLKGGGKLEQSWIWCQLATPTRGRNRLGSVAADAPSPVRTTEARSTRLQA